MAVSKVTPVKKRIGAAERKRREKRKVIWPELNENLLWSRLESNGYITIPRTLPLIMEIINCLTKGAPAGTSYLELWCRSFDESFVELDDENSMAFHAGFTGQRALSTWKGRLKALHSLGFIDLKQVGGTSYALIYNPYHVIYQLHQSKHPGLTSNHYSALRIRASDIGAQDFKEAESVESSTEEKKAASPKTKKRAAKHNITSGEEIANLFDGAKINKFQEILQKKGQIPEKDQ